MGDHLDLTIDIHKGKFRAPVDKLQASALLGRAACNAR
jgi:hypothetical protein